MALFKTLQAGFHVGSGNAHVRHRIVRVDDEALEKVEEQEPFESAAKAQRIAELVYHYGQNEVQPREGCYSLSVGDLVFLGGRGIWKCAGCGWERIEDERAAREYISSVERKELLRQFDAEHGRS